MWEAEDRTELKMILKNIIYIYIYNIKNTKITLKYIGTLF